MIKSYKNLNTGLTLVEVIIASAIILFFLLALFTVHNTYLKMAFSSTKMVKSAYLAEEAIEVVRFTRDSSWNTNIQTLDTGVDYSLVFESGVWVATTSNIFIDDIFERRVVFSEVYRNSSSEIVSSGGSIDPNTRMVTVTVAWKNGTATTTKSISTYLTNLYDN